MMIASRAFASSAVAVIGAAIATFGVINSSSESHTPTPPVQTASLLGTGSDQPGQDKVAKFPVNAAGQTYGSISGLGVGDTYPDLVLVVMNSGNDGYVSAQTVFPHLVDGVMPDEVPGDPSVLGRSATETTIVPAYDSDGQTTIGEFTLG